MKIFTPVFAIGAALVLSACSPNRITEISAVPAWLMSSPSNATGTEQSLAVAARDWSLSNLVVIVPPSLRVSEANTIKPIADIVWQEGPPMDRYVQVAEIMREPLDETLARLDGPNRVQIEVTVLRFHAVTRFTRENFRGQHEIEFSFLVRDARTGAIVRPSERIDLTFPALGGSEAMAAERQGIFQRDRVQARVRDWAERAFGL